MALELPSGLTLYFARHGQTQANVEKRFSGYKDTPLTALGLQQAASVGHILKRELGSAPGYQFVCSPLARAVATMKIAPPHTIIGVPIAGSIPLFLLGVAVYLFFACAVGIFLGTVARSMPQLGLLYMLVFLPMNMLSGSNTPLENPVGDAIGNATIPDFGPG
jgi:hypothetical protein